MISDTARHKLLVLAGHCVERTGELILQSGSFSFFNFIDIFTDQEVPDLTSVNHLYLCRLLYLSLFHYSEFFLFS